MYSTTHLEEEKKELPKDVHILAHLEVRIMDFTEEGIVVTNGTKSSIVLEVKENQDQDHTFHELNANVYNQRVLDFEQGGYWQLRYQGRLYVSMVALEKFP